MKRYWLPLALALLLTVGVARAFAGPLTAGNYTYIVSGQELDLPIDILLVQGQPLVPEEMLAALQIRLETNGSSVRIGRSPASAGLKLGSSLLETEGRTIRLKSFPIRVSGRTFVPAEALSYLGFQVTVEAKFVLVQDLVPAGGGPTVPTGDALTAAWDGHTLKSFIRGTSGAYGNASFTALTPELVLSDRVDLPWGTRLTLLDRLFTQSLLLVTLENTSYRILSMDPAKLLITDTDGRQHDYLKEEIQVQGSVTGSLAPGAKRTSILAFDKMAGRLTLFYEPMNEVIGTVEGP